jgi:hypothetical protein
MAKYRYLLIRGADPALCYAQILEMYQLTGLASLLHPPRLVAIYDDILAVGVPRGKIRAVRAIVTLLDGCRTIKVVGTSSRAKAVAASMRRRGGGA